MDAGNKAMVPGRGGNCLERSGGGWRRTWGIVWALTHLSRENDTEDGYFFSALHQANQAVGHNNTKFGLWLYWYAVSAEVGCLFS